MIFEGLVDIEESDNWNYSIALHTLTWLTSIAMLNDIVVSTLLKTMDKTHKLVVFASGLLFQGIHIKLTRWHNAWHTSQME